ncbi:MAG: (2Fe-2S)-binding protein, partial [Clostridium sp.]
ADTVEKVGEITKAGTTCGRCRPLIQNVIEVKR